LEGDTEQAAMAKIESLVRVLPGPALRLIKYVFDFLVLVASQSSANKMHLQNLAVLHPPSLSPCFRHMRVCVCARVLTPHLLAQLIFGPIMIGSDEEGVNTQAVPYLTLFRHLHAKRHTRELTLLSLMYV
jgi:hypothetical protein